LEPPRKKRVRDVDAERFHDGPVNAVRSGDARHAPRRRAQNEKLDSLGASLDDRRRLPSELEARRGRPWRDHCRIGAVERVRSGVGARKGERRRKRARAGRAVEPVEKHDEVGALIHIDAAVVVRVDGVEALRLRAAEVECVD
jgi:hypothetical protein